MGRRKRSHAHRLGAGEDDSSALLTEVPVAEQGRDRLLWR